MFFLEVGGGGGGGGAQYIDNKFFLPQILVCCRKLFLKQMLALLECSSLKCPYFCSF